MNMMFAALIPILIVGLLQLFVLWGMKESLTRIEDKYVGPVDGPKPKPKE